MTTTSSINEVIEEQVDYGTGGRSWVFTINNPTEKNFQFVKAVPCLRIVAGLERGAEEQTEHIQGAIVFKKVMRWKAVREALGGECWVRKMAGKWSDQEYCLKDGEIIRMEDNSNQGARVKLYAFEKDLKANKRPIEMLKNPDHMLCMAKYPRFESRVREIYAKERTRSYRTMNVIVMWGTSGSGKTKAALYGDDDKMRIDTYLFDDWDTSQKWFDGYEGEERIVFDEFEGQIPEYSLLGLLEGHQKRLSVKGGHTYAEWKEVVITSNLHPKDWWGSGAISARLRRRIKKIEHWGVLGEPEQTIPQCHQSFRFTQEDWEA